MSGFTPAIEINSPGVTFTAGPAPANFQIPTGLDVNSRLSPYYNMRIFNEGPNPAYIRAGTDNTVQAAIPAGTGGGSSTPDIAIPVGLSYIRLPSTFSWVSAITRAAQSAVLQITFGPGGY